LKRGAKDIAAEILEKILEKPNAASTRITSSVGSNPNFVKFLVQYELVTIIPKGKRTKKLQLTDKGKEFLQHYHACAKIFPL